MRMHNENACSPSWAYRLSWQALSRQRPGHRLLPRLDTTTPKARQSAQTIGQREVDHATRPCGAGVGKASEERRARPNNDDFDFDVIALLAFFFFFFFLAVASPSVAAAASAAAAVGGGVAWREPSAA